MSFIALGNAAPGRFRLGRVFAIAASAVRHQWLPMLLFALLLAYAPTAISNAHTTTVTIKVDYPPGVQPPREVFPTQKDVAQTGSSDSSMMIGIGIGAGMFVLGSALGVAITNLTLAGRTRPSGVWRETLKLGFRDTLPLAVLTIVTAAVTTAGYCLFIVPGAILTAAWCLTFPVRIAERTGMIATLRRSAELTRGHRWPIFGLLLVWAAIYVGVLFVSSLWVAGGTSPVLNYLVGPLVGAVASLVINVLVAALYLELRRAHDGVAMESLDTVFA